MEILSERHKAQGSGRDTVIYTYTPTVSLDKVEETFFNLQNKYRGYQAELNSMKHQIEVALQADDRDKSQKEIEEAQQYKVECNPIIAKIIAYRKEAIQTAQSMKIVIPDSLKETYNTISEMGKNK